ncbi:hypothetical protein JCM14467A_03900 [Vulcanisaeta sp. JCM 14467]
MSVFPFGSIAEVRPVLVGIADYAVWGSVFRDFDSSINLYASICGGPRDCSIVLYRSLDGISFREVGTVISDGLTAAPFRFGELYYIVYVDRKRGNRVRLAVSRNPDSGFKDEAIIATPQVFGNAAEIDLGCNVYMRGPMVDLIVSNILPYPRNLYLLRFSVSGNFVMARPLVNGSGVPGPWHSLHNASVYRVGDTYYLLSASNDYSQKPYRGYILTFIMDSPYNVSDSFRYVLIDATQLSKLFVGRETVLGADTPSLLVSGNEILLYLSVVDRSDGPWNLYVIKYKGENYAF